MTIRAVLFDLDGTLLDRDASLLSFAHGQYMRYPEFQVVDQDWFVHRFIELDQHGYVWKDRVYQQLLAELCVQSLDWPSLLQDYTRHFRKNCIPYPNLLSTLTKLKQIGVKLALVSNGFGQFQYENLKALLVDHLFDEVLISEWEGLRKPDPAIFQRALHKLCVPAEQALFVGDHPDNDIRASRAVGMKAVWKRNQLYGEAVEADATIDDLGELLDLVQSGVERFPDEAKGKRFRQN